MTENKDAFMKEFERQSIDLNNPIEKIDIEYRNTSTH